MTTPLVDAADGEQVPAVPDTAAPRGPRGWTRRRKAVVAGATAVVVVLAAMAGYALWAKWRLDQALADVKSMVVFAGIDPSTRPPESPDGGVTFLLAGSDILAPDGTTGTTAGGAPPSCGTPIPAAGAVGPGRSDVVMLVHVNGARTKASIVSIPRDSFVTIPSYVDSSGVSHPAQQRKINAAFSLGGGQLLVRTVELLTGIRIDHFAYIDFDGITRLVDAVGGVTVYNSQATTKVYGNPAWNFPKGNIPLDGCLAHVWVSQRKNLLRSDLDRAANSRELLRAIAEKLVSPALFTNPETLQSTLDMLTRVATVDETLTPGAMKSLALSMRGFNLSTMVMRTAPTDGKSLVNGEMVFHLDTRLTPCLWKAIPTSDLRNVRACSYR